MASLGEVTGSERVVMFDIDGGVADLSAFAHLLTDGTVGSRRQAWQRFFGTVGQVAVLEPGREAVAGLGFVVVYSTTRPVSYAKQTWVWLGENNFPPARALLCRARGNHRASVEAKAGHCRAVGRWLSAFVDDEPETVDALRSRGVRAQSFAVLSGLRVWELRAIPSGKPAARDAVRAFLTDHHAWVRISPATTADGEADLRALRDVPGLLGVMLAETESAAHVDSVATVLPGTPVLALVESALGIERAFEIASAASTVRLAFGTGDFRRDTLASADPQALAYARGRLVVASRAAGIAGPIDGPS